MKQNRKKLIEQLIGQLKLINQYEANSKFHTTAKRSRPTEAIGR
jgi:hypothetical protein